MTNLIKILSNFDIIFFQEIRDSAQTAFPFLMNELNNATNDRYGYNVSIRLGETSSKEQYGFIYDVKKIEVLNILQYVNNEFSFSRPPYGAIVNLIEWNKKMFIGGIHAKPDDQGSRTYDEIIKLIEAVDVFRNNESYGLNEEEKEILNDYSVLLGDLNMDCHYCSEEMKANISNYAIANDMQVLIDKDSTVRESTVCAYDRFIVKNKFIDSYLKANCCDVYNFKDILEIEDESDALLISDHFPIFLNVYIDDNDNDNDNEDNKYGNQGAMIVVISIIIPLFIILFIIIVSLIIIGSKLDVNNLKDGKTKDIITSVI